MAVTYAGSLLNLLGASGFSIEWQNGDTLDAAHTFNTVFLETPLVFCTPSSDNFCYAASSATTGFTPTTGSATSQGAGTLCDWIAIGKGNGQPTSRLFSGFDLQFGAATKDTAITYSYGSFNEVPATICSPISDIGVFAGGTPASTGFTPEDCTGDGGAGTTGVFLSVGRGQRSTLNGLTSATAAQLDAMWIELGTFTVAGAVTFTYPFIETPKILLGMTSDDLTYAASSATTGFTPTACTLGGSGGGTTGVYLAIGAKRQ